MTRVMKTAGSSSPSSVAIVIPTWNHLETTTRPCLESILRFTDLSYRVIIVDNASDDGTGEWIDELCARHPRFQAYHATENLGWDGGSLLGLESVDESFTHVCLLNSDTIVTPGWLSRLVGHLERDPELGSVIPNENPDIESAPIRGCRRWLAACGFRNEPRADGPGAAAEPGIDPGSTPAPPPPSLDYILDVAARLERCYRGRTRAGPPSGFCFLTTIDRLDDLRGYLERFSRFRSGELDWTKYWDDCGATCRIALDTFVFHARGGSGGYYRYDRAARAIAPSKAR